MCPMELSWNVPATWETSKQTNKKPILAHELAIKTCFKQPNKWPLYVLQWENKRKWRVLLTDVPSYSFWELKLYINKHNNNNYKEVSWGNRKSPPRLFLPSLHPIVHYPNHYLLCWLKLACSLRCHSREWLRRVHPTQELLVNTFVQRHQHL